MDIYSNLRRNIVLEGNTYIAGDLFNNLIKEDLSNPEINNPEFYDVSTHTLKLGNLCVRETQKNEKESVEYEGVQYTTYCSLLQLSNNLHKDLQNNLHKDLDTVYNFLRRDLSIDNRRKFHNLIKVLMGYDNQANSINLVAEYIRKTDSVDEVSISLDLFRKKDIDENDIEKFLKQAKHSGYKEYERSFVGSHFKTNENKLFLRYKGDNESRSIYQIVKAVINDELTIKESIGYLYELIIGNYTPQDMVKGDLECTKPVYNKNGDEVIGVGEIVEVKKLDHGGDSYLSEFFAIYKNSSIPKDALKPKFMKTYNTLIDGLYELFITSGGNVLEDIKNNFAGIIYSQNTLIESDDIELYWSNKGRSSCSKDHRLTIRYRINKNMVNGYVYENNEDVLLDKKINTKLDSDKIICPILTPKTTLESFKLDNISDLLLEGRKEDVIKKYSKDDGDREVIEYLSDNDPSGNNKYLEWMVKTVMKGEVYDSGVVDVVTKFHKNIQRIGNKDINSYNTYNELFQVVSDAEERRKLIELEKEAKKQKTIIYDDNRWLVVSPHSHKASCYYGAGTKWCVTTKNTSTHWDRYSSRATFFYIIDKTKKQDDPLYKVAYRKLRFGDKYELWDAEDTEISSRVSGTEYFEYLPIELKEKALKYHEEKWPKLEGVPDWISEDPKAQALNNHLDTYDIEDTEDTRYGMNIYEVGGVYWAVGSVDEMDTALYDYYDEYSDDDLIEYYDYDGYYLTMSDEEYFIDGEVESLTENTSDEEFLERAGMSTDASEKEEQITLLEKILEDGENDDPVDVEEIEEEIESIKEELELIISNSRESFEDEYREEWERCMSDGPVNCLVHDKGWYRNASELVNSGMVELDRDGLLDSITTDGDYDTITDGYGYDEEQDDEGDWWYVFEVDY